ncbi:uncharacterized protein LOC141700235 [Apium graveolens]|uniref:uncharacterized protein LOC141700235 n=1 Tax=Apium graveolens TaxID=4045 RepID=UPI003D7C0A65
MSAGTREQCVLTAMIGWSIWNRRNKWVWERVNGSAFGVLAAAQNLLHDWKEAQVANMSNENCNLDQSLKKWRKPPDGWVTINCDASGVLNGGIGIGCVIRDSHGNFIEARCCKIQGHWQIREAEAISLKEAVSWVRLLGFQYCRFETDSQVLVWAIKGQSGESYFHTIVSQCVNELKHIDQVLVDFVYRSANGVAHLLASAAHSMSGCGEWLVTPPEFINDVLDLDSV